MHNLYTIKPTLDNHPTLQHAAGVFCLVDKRFLLVQRALHLHQGGTWCLPGGKVELNETCIDAAAREMQEETGIVLNKKQMQAIGAFHITSKGTSFIFHIFFQSLRHTPEVTLLEKENINYLWTNFDEAKNLNLIIAGKDMLDACERFSSIYSKPEVHDLYP